jgi:hypothetical protein
MASRSRIKMAYQTHYVGDLRAINDDLIDTYQLKSLDGQTEISDTDESKFITKDGKKYIVPINFDGNFTNKEVSPGYFFPYDSIIRCTGFKVIYIEYLFVCLRLYYAKYNVKFNINVH